MANHGCTNGTLDGAGYSSPVPIIGLYIASASLLCTVLMLCDVVNGIHSRKCWLPCKYFKLNSVTLTLLSVASKLPVDLTTAMPSTRDQLSKLSGTTFICISMCFLMPSLGDSPQSESFTNMVALTIFVVTVFVNICMQLSTGVIVLFFTEHIIILCSLLILLLIMWHSYWESCNTKKQRSQRGREIFTKDDGSVFHRLKASYLYVYEWNPQLVASLNYLLTSITVICTLCSGTLIRAAFGLLIQKHLKFCSENSDYDWSIPAILFTQILTVILGNAAVISRWLTMSRYLDTDLTTSADKIIDDAIRFDPLFGIVSRLDHYGRVLRSAFICTMKFLECLIGLLPNLATILFWNCIDDIHDDMAPQGWLGRKCNEDLQIWINKSKSEHSNHLSQLLISRNYPYQEFDTMEVIDPSLPDQKGVFVSSLSILLVARIAQVSLPENYSTSLTQTLRETEEIFHYIEKRIYPKNFINNKRLLFAKGYSVGQDFSCLLPKIFNTTTNPRPHLDLEYSLSVITQLKTVLPSSTVSDEVGVVADFVNRKTYSTIEELVTSLEQMFVDMVRVMLSQLPNAIFKSLSDSTDEEYEENAKLGLKLTCKVESVAAYIRWSFPPGCNFTSFVTAEDGQQLGAIQQSEVSSADRSNQKDAIIPV